MRQIPSVPIASYFRLPERCPESILDNLRAV